MRLKLEDMHYNCMTIDEVHLPGVPLQEDTGSSIRERGGGGEGGCVVTVIAGGAKGEGGGLRDTGDMGGDSQNELRRRAE